jgi:hypothetical protein
MNNKISDFKLSEFVLKSICRESGEIFIDLPIFFEKEDMDLSGLFIGETKNVVHTMYKIVDMYLNSEAGVNLFNDDISKNNFLISFANMLRGIFYSENSFFDNFEELTLQYLYQSPVIWILLKDLICPVFKVPLQNIKVVVGKTPYVDISRYYEKGEVKEEEDANYPFVFVNQVANQAVQSAFLLVETLKAYKLDVVDTIKTIFESDLYGKFKGLLKLAFDDDSKVNEFITILIYILGINLLDFVPSKTASVISEIRKFAQAASANTDRISEFWFLGILESMLEPIRGTDWGTYETLEKYNRDFWDKVEKVKIEKVKKGEGPGIPFDELLRLKQNYTTSYKADPNKTLQSLLSSDRVW